MIQLQIGNETLTIEHDDYCTSPRKDYRLSTFYFSNHNNEAKGFRFEESYDSITHFLEEGPKEIQKHSDEIAVILPVYKYEHSGVVFATTPFSCPWDSGLIGFAVVTKKEARESFQCKNITKKIVTIIKSLVEGELETFSNWANSNCYGFRLEVDGEETESCGGFIANDPLRDIIESGYLDDKWKEVRETEAH
jgi:hypothetical protein